MCNSMFFTEGKSTLFESKLYDTNDIVFEDLNIVPLGSDLQTVPNQDLACKYFKKNIENSLRFIYSSGTY